MIFKQVRWYKILLASTSRFQVSEYFIVDYVKGSSRMYVEQGLILKQMQAKKGYLFKLRKTHLLLEENLTHFNFLFLKVITLSQVIEIEV